MLACRSSTDRLLKIRYLDQNGGNFQAKDLWVRRGLFATQVNEETVIFLLREKIRLCFMPPNPQSVKMTK